MKGFRATAVAAGGLFLLPFVASAHAFGTQYTLPLPVNFYILGGVGAFLASSLVLFLFSDPIADLAEDAEPAVRSYRHPALVLETLSWLGLVAFIVELVLAFAGSASFVFNPAVVLFWIILMLGFTYFSVFVGGVWDFVNPFRTLARWILGEDREGAYDYPAWLSYFPAMLFFFGLIEFELFSGGGGSVPQVVGIRLVIYAIICIAGSALFGTKTWFEKCDAFSVFFRMVSLFAPVQVTKTGVCAAAPARKLVKERAPHLSLVLFILLMLSSTALDGIKDTTPWGKVLIFLSGLGLPIDANAIGIVALALSPFLFFALYAAAVYAMKLVTRTTKPLLELLLAFGYSLIPIAIVYHFAHYFTLLMGDGQRLIYQVSDPFGRGWNLFGTAKYTYNPVPIGADIIWYLQLGAIVLGHVVAAVIAHRISLRIFKDRKDIVLSQLPMLVLMVAYTAFGLWVLSRAFVPG